MEKLIKHSSLILLVALSGLTFYKDSIAISIAIGALSALVGFKMFLDSKAQPDYRSEFRKELKQITSEVIAIKRQTGVKGNDSTSTVTDLKGWG